MNNTLRHCTDRLESETHPEYASRVLRYALTYGIEPLAMSQLELADACAAESVAGLPGKLSYDQGRLDEWLHALRLRLQARMHEKRAQLAATQRLLNDLESDPQDDQIDAQTGAGMAELTDQDRALKLLRAALSLIMGPQPPSNGGGGTPAKLIPPSPTRPPAGSALTIPGSPAAQPRRF